jgi:hypothetical protein
MGGARSTNEEGERMYVKNQKERNSLKDRDVGGWIILRWILERLGDVCWIALGQDSDKWRAVVMRK